MIRTADKSRRFDGEGGGSTLAYLKIIMIIASSPLPVCTTTTQFSSDQGDPNDLKTKHAEDRHKKLTTVSVV